MPTGSRPRTGARARLGGGPAPGGVSAAPPGELRRRRMLLALAAVVALMALTVLGVRACAPGSSSDPREMRDLAVGDCVRIVPRPDKGRGATGGMNITHEEVPCGTPGVVTYAVAAVHHGQAACPNPNYQEYWEVDDTRSRDARLWTICLMPHLRPGSCYEPDNQTKAFVAAACGPNSLFRVESSADVDDPRRCSGAAEPFAFPVPGRTYCVTSLT